MPFITEWQTAMYCGDIWCPMPLTLSSFHIISEGALWPSNIIVTTLSLMWDKWVDNDFRLPPTSGVHRGVTKVKVPFACPVFPFLLPRNAISTEGDPQPTIHPRPPPPERNFAPALLEVCAHNCLQFLNVTLAVRSFRIYDMSELQYCSE